MPFRSPFWTGLPPSRGGLGGCERGRAAMRTGFPGGPSPLHIAAYAIPSVPGYKSFVPHLTFAHLRSRTLLHNTRIAGVY
ncbi:hypothetical protein BGX38DRAFT_75977 [Terfezia claveryi]|nr:hypothetical protein BGX38DRAFT_75977 [Terfezia claveryi]